MASAGRAVTGPELPAQAGGSASADAAAAAAIERALRRVLRRVRLQRALSGASVMAVAGLGVLALGLCLDKAGDASGFVACAALSLALPLLGALLAGLWPCSPLLAARLLDRSLQRPDLLASAAAFARLPPGERSPFMRACVLQAGDLARSADVQRAMPLRAPRALRPAGALALGVALLAALQVKQPLPVVAKVPPRPRLLHQDDVQAFRHEVAPLLVAPDTDPVLRTSAAELNALLEALHGGELDRAQALAELRAIEKKLELAASPGDEQALREALQELGRALAGDALAKPVADAFQSGQAQAARAELERLAAQLEADRQRADAQRSLAKALARAARPPAAQHGAADRARQELERLLARKQQAQQDPAAERLLRDKRRELEKLSREQQQRESAQRSLEDLRRDLAAAAPPLQSQRSSEASQRLREAAGKLGQAGAQQRSAEQRKQLAERLAQLRELLSKQRAQAGKAGEPGKQAQQGQPQPGAGKRLDMDGFARAAQGEGQPQDGSGQPQADGKLLVPGQGQGAEDGATLLPGQDAQSSRTLQIEREAEGPGTGEPGQGGRPQPGAATSAESTRIDTRVQGAAEGQGPTRSQVIREAGQRGFVTRDYQRVHADYERHAEAVLEHDRVPGGYRFYVRRYFQLIRPREGEP